MLCAISGEAPTEPVASKKSGNVFEKRLIESYISENGRDPVNGEELGLEDLIDLKSARVVKPRPPTLTSIPSLLSVFQNEWDAVALETYTLKQHLSQLRQELSTALYNNDAAVRVIARLNTERDEARDALSKVSLNDRKPSASASNGDAMQVDGASLPEEIAAKIDATHQSLSKTRRKRPVPEDWATSENLQSLEVSPKPKKMVPPGSVALSADQEEHALFGGSDGSISLYSTSKQKVIHKVKVGGSINSVVLQAEGRYASADSTGTVTLFEGKNQLASFSVHAGPATALALHPTGDILASVGADKSFVLYDLVDNKVLSQVFTDSALSCCQFHPDGYLLAVGGEDSQIKIFEVKSGSAAADIETSGPVHALSFSENGTWLATASQGSTTVSVWDIRKTAAPIKDLDFGTVVDAISWDYTGQYLAGVGSGSVAIHHYEKATKSWSEPLRRAASATAVAWGPSAKSLILLTTNGELNVAI